MYHTTWAESTVPKQDITPLLKN
uniref:Uncharacterized protein n=1 Tax=Arundo donax TaxID=35708 RepID=A0A0A8ZRS0_ARUDO